MKNATGREIEKAIREFMPIGKAYNTEELSFFCKDKQKHFIKLKYLCVNIIKNSNFVTLIKITFNHKNQ